MRTFLVILATVSFCFAISPTVGVDLVNGDQKTISAFQLGYCNTTILDASSADASASATWTNCRAISVDSSGVVKIAYLNVSGDTITEVKKLVEGGIYPIRNVVKLFRYYTGTTAGTARSYSTAGVLTTNSIKLHK